MAADEHSSWLGSLVNRLLSKETDTPTSFVARPPTRFHKPDDPQIRAMQKAMETDISWIRCPEDRTFLKRLAGSLAKATRSALGMPRKLTVGEWRSVDYRLTATWYGAVSWDSAYTEYLQQMHPARVSKVIVSTVLPDCKVLATRLLDSAVEEGDDPFELSEQLGVFTIVSVFVPSQDSEEAAAELRERAAADRHCRSPEAILTKRKSEAVAAAPTEAAPFVLPEPVNKRAGPREKRRRQSGKVSLPSHGTL